MASESKHRQIVVDYVAECNIEPIIRNSIRSLIQSNKVPDNPFGAMYRHFTYFSGKEDLRKSQEIVKGTEFKELDQASLFSITNQKSELDCFGLAHLLHYINVDHFKVLYKSLKDLCVEQKRKYEAGPYTLEVRTSIGGGEIFKSPLVPHPEVSSTPLEIRAECIVEGPKFEAAFTLFSDYVFDDIMKIGSNNALNLVRDFNVEQGPGSSHVKRLTLESMQHNKQLLVNELKNATIQKRNSYIRVLVFSQDLERYSSKDLIRAVTPSRLLSLTEPSVLDHFQFISTKKYYVLHFTTTGSPTDFQSLGIVPCMALYSGLFPNPDSAKHYAKVFCLENSSPYEIQALEVFFAYKREKIAKYYKSGKLHKMAWELLALAMTNKNHMANYAIVSEIFSLLAHPCSKLFRIVRQCKALIILVNSFYDTGFPHFQKLAEGLFVRLKEEAWSAFGNPSTAEMLLLKPLIIKMLDHISVNKSRTLKIIPSTLRVLERLENLCTSIAACNYELLIRNLPSLSDSLQRLLFSLNIKPSMTFSQFTDKKQTELAFDIDQELKTRNMRKNNEYLIIYEYLVKTGVVEALILTTREIVMSYPLVPNPLKTYASKLMSALFKYEMFQLTVPEIMEQHMHVPNEVSDGVFVHSSPDNIYNKPDLPYVVGSEEVLLVSAWQEIGLFKTILRNYELDTSLFSSLLPRGYTMQSVLAVCGGAVVNHESLSKFPSLWTVYNEVLVTGPSFNVASHTFFELLVQYALWLDNSTDALVVGFFSPFASDPLASFEDLVATNDREHSVGLILSTFQMNSRVWLRFVLPFAGEQSSGVVGVPIAVHIYFNLHFRVNFSRKVTSLVQIDTLEDIVKVFYSREDFETWKELTQDQTRSFPENLLDDFTLSSSEGKHYRASTCLLFSKLLQKNKETVSRLLRINETPIKSIVECSRFARNLVDLLRASAQGHRKKSPSLNRDYTDKFAKYLEATFYQERNVFLENSQMSVLRVAEKLVLAIRNENGQKYSSAVSALRLIMHHLNTAKTVASLAIHEVLEGNEETAR